MTFDVLLDQVGGLGRFQILQIVLFYITNILVMPHVLLDNFTAAVPDHRCWADILDNDTVPDSDTGILSQDALLRVSIPLDSNLRPDKCRRFTHPQWQLLHLNGTFSNMTEPDTEPCMDGWVYDRSYFLSTIVTEWDLVCESQSLKPLVQTLFMTGSLLGSLIYGRLSDRFGRKVIYTCCLLHLAIADTCAAFAPTFLVYCILRFLAGIPVMNLLANSFILTSEWTTSRSQSMGAMLMTCSYSTGQMFLGGLAFSTRNWRMLHLILSIPIFVFFISSRKLAESARWLITTNKLDEGLKELRRVAHINGKKNTGETLTTEFVKSTMQKELEAAQTKVSIFQLLRARKLRLRICCICFVRMAITVPLYGLTLNLQHLGSNIFLFQVIFGAVAFAARCVAHLTLNHMGRRLSQIPFLFLVGVCILVNTFVSPEMQTLHVVLAALGVGAGSAAASNTNVHQNELTPTIFRSTIGGLNAVFSRVGAVLAPLLMTLMVYSLHLPWIIYGVFPILAGLVVFHLPETRNQPLPNTIQDIENETNESRKIKKEDTSTKVTQF